MRINNTLYNDKFTIIDCFVFAEFSAHFFRSFIGITFYVIKLSPKDLITTCIHIEMAVGRIVFFLLMCLSLSLKTIDKIYTYT